LSLFFLGQEFWPAVEATEMHFETRRKSASTDSSIEQLGERLVRAQRWLICNATLWVAFNNANSRRPMIPAQRRSGSLCSRVCRTFAAACSNSCIIVCVEATHSRYAVGLTIGSKTAACKKSSVLLNERYNAISSQLRLVGQESQQHPTMA